MMSNARLIQSRSGAMFSVFVTGFVAYMTVRGALSHRVSHSRWLIVPFDPLPHWAAIALNLFVYMNLIWLLCFTIVKVGSGKERAITVGFFTTLLLELLQLFVPQDIAVSIQYAKGFAICAAFLMSVLIAFSFLVLSGPRPSD